MAPTCEQIFQDELGEPIFSSDDASWRHGSRRTEVYLRTSDHTYWRVHYCVSTDGETNELREGLAQIAQVEPYEKMVIAYRPLKVGGQG